MCGRFGLTDPLQLQRGAGLFTLLRPDVVSDDVAPLLVPRFNVAPAQPVIAARTRPPRRGDGGSRPERHLDVLRWGLVPRWAKDPNIGNTLANARAETLASKPAFRNTWAAGQRCLIVADVFFEWQDLQSQVADPRNGDPGTTGRRPVARAASANKQPHAIRMTEDEPFAFGGLWEAWRDPAGDAATPAPWLRTCTIITTAPNGVVGRLHDRMPVIIPPSAYDAWLDPRTPLEDATELLAPYPASAMRSYPVSTYVNSPRHDDAGVLVPLSV